MNYLQMAQFVQAQIGTSADLPWAGPTTVVGQTGQYAEIVNWIQMAYKAIQTDQTDWNWRTKQGLFQLTNNQNVYTIPQLQALVSDYEDIAHLHDVDDNRYSLIYQTSLGVASETQCIYIEYQDWRGWKDRNVIPTGKPTYYTQRPDGSLEFNPIPLVTGDTYTFVTDYVSTLDTMAVADATVPATMPAKYHEAICWKAIMYWALQRENQAKYEGALGEYNRVFNNMAQDQLPDIDLDFGAFYGRGR